MGASVLEGGDASQLFKAEYMEDCPQVHLHFLTDDNEFDLTGNGKVELVCHGCGASQLVSYDRSKSKRRMLAIRNVFAGKHKQCLNRGYEKCCPSYRSTFDHLDIRRTATVQRKLGVA
jgi:hypothetical protein